MTLTIPSARGWMAFIGWSFLASGAAQGGIFDSSVRKVQVGHWLEIKGELTDDLFVASWVELRAPERYEIIIGTAEQIEASSGEFALLHQAIQESEKTDWEGIDKSEVVGKRVKVEGYYRGLNRFAAREVAPRGSGRDRLARRVEEITNTSAGVEVRVMCYRVLLPHELSLEHDLPMNEIELAQPRWLAGLQSSRDDDDFVGEGIAITDALHLGIQFEIRSSRENNFDLDLDDPEDRDDHEGGLRARFVWEPFDTLGVVAEVRSRVQYRDDDEDGITRDQRTRLGESFIHFGGPLGLHRQIGRQDFDERREWLYDQNLDAVRLFGSWSPVRLELSVSTSLSDAGERDRASTNYIAYLSNQNSRRHLAGYAIYRDIGSEFKETPSHLGVRLNGSWLPRNRLWLELAHLGGQRAGVKLDAWGFDLGTTWSNAAKTHSLTVGYAFGSGDDDVDDGVSHTFRQTGLQDNNNKFGGVTSFRYYGELVDPELANLQILTLGWGAQPARRLSIDLVWHHYRQHHPTRRLVDVELDRRPDGIHRELGWEIDAIVGWRRSRRWDIEAVGAYFRRGKAYTSHDDAYLLKFQLRLRL